MYSAAPIYPCQIADAIRFLSPAIADKLDAGLTTYDSLEVDHSLGLTFFQETRRAAESGSDEQEMIQNEYEQLDTNEEYVTEI